MKYKNIISYVCTCMCRSTCVNWKYSDLLMIPEKRILKILRRVWANRCYDRSRFGETWAEIWAVLSNLSSLIEQKFARWISLSKYEHITEIMNYCILRMHVKTLVTRCIFHMTIGWHNLRGFSEPWNNSARHWRREPWWHCKKTIYNHHTADFYEFTKSLNI